MTAWLIAFVWTLVLETPVYASFLDRESRTWRGPLLASLALNLMTHPLFSWWVLGAQPAESAIAVAECGIFVAEGLALAAMRACNPRAKGRGARLVLPSVGIAFCANAFSYGVGLLLFS